MSKPLQESSTSGSDVESEIREKSIEAIFKGIVEVENEIDSSTTDSVRHKNYISTLTPHL